MAIVAADFCSVEPEVAQDSPEQQHIPAEFFYPSEGSGGATYNSLHDVGNQPWLTAGGDWRDANDVLQGDTSFGGAQTVTNTDTEQDIEWDVTTLAQNWQNGTLENWGVFLRLLSSNLTVRFHSKESVVGASPPTLHLVFTDLTTQDLTAQSDCYISGPNPSGASQGTTFNSTVLLVSSTNKAIIRFDLSGVTKTISQAILQCRTNNNQAGSTGTVGVFRVALEAHQAPISYEVGIANSFAFDANIISHPDVVMYCDWADYTVGVDATNRTRFVEDGWGVVGASSFGPGSNKSIVGDTDPDNPNYSALFPGCKAIKCTIVPPNGGFELGEWRFYGNLGPIWEADNVATTGNSGNPEEPDEIYFRYYVYIGDDWEPDPEGGKFFGLWGSYDDTSGDGPIVPPPPGGPYPNAKHGGVRPLFPSQAGNGGILSYTCSGWSRRGGFENVDGFPSNYSALTAAGYRRFSTINEDWSSTYLGAPSGSRLHWNTGSLGFIQVGTWNCIEHRIRMNTIDTSGATLANVGYPGGTLYTDSVIANLDSVWQADFSPRRTNVCSQTGTANTIILDAGATASYLNNAVWIASRPSEIRRVIAQNGIELTITEHDGSSNTWDNVPQAGETFVVQGNTQIKQRSTLWFGNRSEGPPIYYDNNSTLSSPDTQMFESAGIGRKDGIHEVWVNGRKTMSRTTEWWRSIPQLQINAVFARCFMGGDPSGINPPHEMSVYFTHPVCAKSYIGTMGGI